MGGGDSHRHATDPRRARAMSASTGAFRAPASARATACPLISPTSSKRSSLTWGGGHIPLMARHPVRWPSQVAPRGPVLKLHSPRKGRLWHESTFSGTLLPKCLLRFRLSHQCATSILTGAGERANQRHLLGILEGVGAAYPKGEPLYT